ncbi:16065_t:CDS:2, partial [Racocetra persica]
QTELLSQSLYVEIDMVFKRIHGATNEWKICAYVHRYQKALIIARVFTNFQSAKAYQYLFEDLFDIVENDMYKPFEFQHIHGRGLGCIIVDEHQGQAL